METPDPASTAIRLVPAGMAAEPVQLWPPPHLPAVRHGDGSQGTMPRLPPAESGLYGPGVSHRARRVWDHYVAEVVVSQSRGPCQS